MDNHKLRELLYGNNPQANSRKQKLRQIVNSCYTKDIKTLQQKETEVCAFDLAYELFMETDIFRNPNIFSN